jgi:hypothetical protein
MKQRRKMNQLQTQLFREPELSNVSVPLELTGDREAELRNVIAELLLRVALAAAEVPREGEYDE